MNSNNNDEIHEIAVYQHLNGRFAHSSVLFRLTSLLFVIVLLRYKQEMAGTTLKTSRRNAIVNND